MALTALALAFTVDVSLSDQAGVQMELPDQIDAWTGDELRYSHDRDNPKQYQVSELELPDIDPETGEVLEIKEGLTGELVYTSLDRESQPLIRFRTRDHILVTQTRCDCGRTGFCVKCIGRTDDMLIVSGVNVYPSAIRDVVGTLLPRVTGEILIQLREPPPSATPPLKIKVEHGAEPGDLAVLKKDIENAIREKLIFSSSVELVSPGTLPKFEYKAKLVENPYN